MGPSLFTMPHFVDELFSLAGENPRDYFNYKKKETVCNYWWEDGTTFSAAADPTTFVHKASATFQEPEEKLQAYLANNKTKYEATKKVFLEKSLHKASTYLSKDTLKALLKMGKMGIHQNLNQVNASYFKHPKLVQLFNRYATYNGSSPYKTPGIMSLIPHLEMEIGTFYPKGGMYTITQSIYELAKRVGVQFKFKEAVTKINVTNGKAVGITTEKADYDGDTVVSNMDIYPTYKKLLHDQKQPEKVLQQERSSAALIFYWGMDISLPEMNLHNIFFSDNYQEEFRHIFDEKTVYHDPTIYVNITAKETPEDAPKNHENWFVMVNVPGDYGQDWDQIKKETRKNCIDKLSRLLKVDILSKIKEEMIWDPVAIANDTSSYRGALYGAASNSKFAAFLRHPNFSNTIKNLYFCGGSVHPGGGIPLCLLSAKIVADLVPNA